jgi:hypothetical protein
MQKQKLRNLSIATELVRQFATSYLPTLHSELTRNYSDVADGLPKSEWPRSVSSYAAK